MTNTFILPPLIYEKYCKKNKLMHTLINYYIIVAGIISGIIGVYASLETYIHS